MRGEDERQQGIFSYVSLEQRVPGEHPLGPVRKLVDEIFRGMSKQFDELYSATGRPSIAPERLLRALLLQILPADLRNVREIWIKGKAVPQGLPSISSSGFGLDARPCLSSKSRPFE